MIRIVEAQARDFEDEFLEKSLSRFGNCFNAWNQIKTGGTGAVANYTPAAYTSQVTSKSTSAMLANKRTRKINDKEKEKEQIYMSALNDDRNFGRSRNHDSSRIDFLSLA